MGSVYLSDMNSLAVEASNKTGQKTHYNGGYEKIRSGVQERSSKEEFAGQTIAAISRETEVTVAVSGF
jgi:hypothetical protein